MKLLILLILSLSTISADNILNNYRLHGIDNIEKQLDYELTSPLYWEKELQKIDTTFGYLESYSSILSCDKNESTLSLYEKDENSTYNLIKKYNAFTGKKAGDKKIEGDLKTPIGIYQLEERLDKETKLDPFYGPLAFVTSYPNLYDRIQGKNGSGIWVHGLPIKRERDEFTRGCIAINNENIECLDNNIDITNTIIIINPSEHIKTTKEKLNLLLTQLYKWRYSWLYSDIQTYLSFYADDFTRFDGMKIDQFSKYKTRIFKKNEKKTILFSDINIIPYPNTNDIYQITFKEYYKSSTFEFRGDKMLMVRIDKSNNFKIFVEK